MPYSRDQIYAAIRKADQAGDADAVRALSRQLRSMDEPRDVDTSNLDVTDAQAALARGERRLQERTADMTPAQQRRARQRYNADPRIRELRDRADDPAWERLATTSLADVGRSAQNVLGGAAQGLLAVPDMLMDASEGVQRIGNRAVTGVADAVLRAGGLDEAADWVKRGGESVEHQLTQAPSAASVIEQVAPTRPGGEASRVMSQFLGGVAVPLPIASTPKPVLAPRAAAPVSEAAQVVREGQRAGVRVMTSDVRPPKTFIGKTTQAIGERIPWAGTGGPRAAQQAQRVEAVRTLLRDVGGDDVVQLFDDTPSALDDVARSLTAQRGRELTRLTGQKKAVISRLSGAGEVPVGNTLQAIDDQIAMLTQRGTKPSLEVVEDLKSLRTAMQGKTLDQLEAIRADELSNAFAGNTLADVRAVGEKAIRAIYSPLRDDMGAFIASRGAKGDLQAWKGANERLSALAGELDATTFRNVLKNAELTPETVGRLLFSRNRSDVARLYSNLDATGKARAQAAVIQRAFDKAINAQEGLSVERFVSNLTQMGSSIGVVFQGDDLARVQGLAKVLDATRRASAASAAPATGVQNTPAVGGYALGTLFGKAAIPIAGAGGVLARAYESAPVRNLLLKLSKTAPGSAAESKLMERISRLAVAGYASQGQRLANAANENVPAVGRAAASPDEGPDEGERP